MSKRSCDNDDACLEGGPGWCTAHLAMEPFFAPQLAFNTPARISTGCQRAVNPAGFRRRRRQVPCWTRNLSGASGLGYRMAPTPFHSDGMVRSLRFPGQARL